MIKEVCDANEIRAPSMVTGAAAASGPASTARPLVVAAPALLLGALPCLIIQARKCCGS